MTNEREEMARMAEAAEAITDEQSVIDAMKAAEPVTEDPAPAKEDLSGGLDTGLTEEPEDNTIDLDAILGISPKEPETPETEQAPAPEAPPEPSAEQQRISELSEQLRVSREQNDKFVEKALAGRESEQTETAEPTEELDPEMESYMKGYIDNYMEKNGMAPDQFRSALAPIQEQSENQQYAEAIAMRVPGFKAEHMVAVREAYSKFPEGSQEANFYGQGAAGATQLAQDLVSRGALDVGQRKPNKSNPLANRHRSEAGATPPLTEGEDDMAKAVRIMDIPDDEFRARFLDG